MVEKESQTYVLRILDWERIIKLSEGKKDFHKT